MESNQTGVKFMKIVPGKAVPNRKRLVLLSLSAFLGLFSILSFFFIHSVLTQETIYHGILVDGADMGGKTREELFSYLENHYGKLFDDLTLTVFGERFEKDVTAAELGFRINIGKMVQTAYDMGREGNILDRLIKIAKLIANPCSLSLELDFETPAFGGFLDKACSAGSTEVTPPNIVILEDRVVLCTGIPGKEVDRDRLKADIIAAVKSQKSARIALSTIEKQPPGLDLETTLKTLNSDPVDAKFVKTSRTTYEIRPHEMGRRISRDQLREIMNYVETRKDKAYEEILLPVEFIEPAVTEEMLKAEIFRDTLASYSTHFRTDTENNFNRSINIGLAAESIDGTILMPDEEFSFNKVVGPRTAQKGYKIAHVFVDGQIRDGTGGGVCQVSTTLYNAVLRSNLPVLERHNHMFAVSYVPLGMDAAVSYGYADLAFKNNTAYPLVIKAYVSAGTLTFKLLGTNAYPDLKVKLATKTIKTIKATTQYVEDASLPIGTVIIAENGMDGYIVDTYMKLFNGDTLIKEEKIHRSIYQMHPRKIIRGTAAVFEMIE